MLTQYIVSLGATDLRKSRERSAKADNSPQANNERSYQVHLSMESFCIVFAKIDFATRLQAQPCS